MKLEKMMNLKFWGIQVVYALGLKRLIFQQSLKMRLKFK